jgi:hypothetical protein
MVAMGKWAGRQEGVMVVGGFEKEAVVGCAGKLVGCVGDDSSFTVVWCRPRREGIDVTVIVCTKSSTRS